MASGSTSADRYRLLVEQIRDELGGERGWKTRAAEMLGVTQPFVAYVADGVRDGGRDSIDKAIQSLRIRSEFFFDETLDSPHFRDFIGSAETRVELDAGVRRALEEFLASFDLDDARRPTPDEIEWMKGLSFREWRSEGLEVTPSLYDRYLRERRAQLAGKVRDAPRVEPPTPRSGRVKMKR